MLRIATKTKLSPEDVIDKANEYFGPKGHQLEVTDKSADCISFKGAGGIVEVTTCLEDNGTSVEFVSTEWDYQVKEFIGKIH